MSAALPAIDRDWLLARVAAILGDDGPFQADQDLTLFGLDSMGILRLIVALDEQGIEVGLDELLRQPTLDGWWDLIRQHRGG